MATRVKNKADFLDANCSNSTYAQMLAAAVSQLCVLLSREHMRCIGVKLHTGLMLDKIIWLQKMNIL